MRDLHVGETVVGADGSRLGRIDRIVVDQAAHRVTHVVIDGHLIGIQRLRENTKGELSAALDRAGLEARPSVDLDHLAPPGQRWLAPAGRRLSDFLAVASSVIGQVPYVPPTQADFELEGEHEIKKNSPVWSGQTRLGDVDEVLMGGSGNRIESLVLKLAGFRGRKVVIPSDHIVEVVGSNVHVDLSPEQVQALPER